MTVGVKYEADAKTFAFENFTIDGVEMGSVGLKADFTDVAPTLFGADNGGRMQALLEAGVASIEVKLVNGGLFDKALAYSAKQQGVAPDKLRAQWSAMVGQTAPVMLGGSPVRPRAGRRGAEIRRRSEKPDDQRQGQERRAESGRLHGDQRPVRIRRQARHRRRRQPLSAAPTI